jgi:hypothetical protein
MASLPNPSEQPSNAKWHAKWHNKEETKKLGNLAKHYVTSSPILGFLGFWQTTTSLLHPLFPNTYNNQKQIENISI